MFIFLFVFFRPDSKQLPISRVVEDENRGFGFVTLFSHGNQEYRRYGRVEKRLSVTYRAGSRRTPHELSHYVMYRALVRLAGEGEVGERKVEASNEADAAYRYAKSLEGRASPVDVVTIFLLPKWQKLQKW